MYYLFYPKTIASLTFTEGLLEVPEISSDTTTDSLILVSF